MSDTRSQIGDALRWRPFYWNDLGDAGVASRWLYRFCATIGYGVVAGVIAVAVVGVVAGALMAVFW